MLTDQQAVDFLGQLERAEVALLSWGLVDGFFSRPELEDRAEQFLSARTDAAYASGADLIDSLIAEHLLWRLPNQERYRTRMAEAVRLFARLRQIFPDKQYSAWRTAPALVADYRLIVRRRIFPRRDTSPAAAIEQIRLENQLAPIEQTAIRALLEGDGQNERHLAGFQVRATARVLRSFGSNRLSGTVICAGTGSGKTLAFYIPAFARIVSRITNEYWTKCLALYPRNELLKDQFREALINARRLAPALQQYGRRKLVLGALYGGVPTSARSLLSGVGGWRALATAHGTAYECPFVNCHLCGQAMAWSEADITVGLERLTCIDSRCGAQIESDEIRLTRDRMFAQPPDILFTSTEMLNQRMSSNRYANLFGIGVSSDRRPDFVLLDEVHSYEGVHGAHVALLLRRWRRASQARAHMVGLSATLADAPRFFADLVGIGPGSIAEVSPQDAEMTESGNEYMLALRGDPASGASLLSVSIQAAMLLRRILDRVGDRAHFGSRVFTFTDNLDVINRLYHNLLDAEGWDAFGRPNRAQGSLANLRSTTLPSARERFEAGQNWALVEDIGQPLGQTARVPIGRTSSQDIGVDPTAEIIVASSSLEVGFDDPEVGAVLQHKSPHTAAAFLQRKGRAGRRPDMRPWTVVVLSDYGADRIAYQSYDQLFSPNLPAKYLPLGNRAVLRMQATYALIDWLNRSLLPSASPDPWADMSQPADRAPNSNLPEHVRIRLATEIRERQNRYAERLRAILENLDVRSEFSDFLVRSLAVDLETVTAILWEPPRALLTEAVPTLLRRLETGWIRTSGPTFEYHVPRLPLPEFIPGALFGDLQLPEVSVHLPAFAGNAPRVESMPLAQALQEFAPGRISRRFGVRHAGERHWVSPRDDNTIPIESFCPPTERQELGSFAYRSRIGIENISVVRPYAINVSLPPNDVQQSSNSFLVWHTEIVPTDEGHEIDSPTGSRWSEVLGPLRFHTHNLGRQIELRRFSSSAEASIGRGRGGPVQHHVRFCRVLPSGEMQSAAVGFIADVDAIQLSFEYPRHLEEMCQADSQLLRGLRPARFRELVSENATLDDICNRFQRDSLAQAYFTTISVEALRCGSSLQSAEATVHQHTSATQVSEILETMMIGDLDTTDRDGQDAEPRRLTELLNLLQIEEVAQALHQSAPVLWESVDQTWTQWIRHRFRSSLGAAMVEAARSLCPRMNADGLAVEVDSRPLFEFNGREDEIWLSELTIGGGGFVEEFLTRYAQDPRRFYRLFEAALAPSDLESVATDLERTLECVTAGNPENESLRQAFAALRNVLSHEDSRRAVANLRTDLARRGILPTQTLLVALNTRVIRPGTNRDTDAFLATLIRDWNDAEERLGVDIDARAFSLVRSADASLEQLLGFANFGESEKTRQAWRYSVLYGMLWPRGAQLRAESLKAQNPFVRLPPCDRLLLLRTIPHAPRAIELARDGWFHELAQALVSDGQAEVVVNSSDPNRLTEALLVIAAQPIDAGAILVYARLVGIQRDADELRATIELPEAIQ
jgi:hypothetical protein